MTGSYVDEEHGQEEVFADPGKSKIDTLLSRKPIDATGAIAGWGYLGLLCLITLGLTIFAKGCDGGETNDEGESVAMAVTETELGNSVDLRIQVDGDTVTLVGSVPDEGARDQLISATARQYGQENVVDQLQVDEAATLTDGVVTAVGNAEVGDARPENVQETIVAELGLLARANSVDRGEQMASAVSVSVIVNPDGAITTSGAVPDQSSVDEFVAVIVDVWGISSIDSSGLVVDENVTWEQGTIRVTGSVGSDDERSNQLEVKISEQFGALVTTDLSGLEIEDPIVTAEQVETDIATKLAAQPILFAPESSDIDSGSDAVLSEIAGLLVSLPSASVELVGHTDDIGSDDDNLELSEQRAAAVRQRLIDEGVDEARISARGAGEAQPLVANDSAENRASNRRIEFVLVDSDDE